MYGKFIESPPLRKEISSCEMGVNGETMDGHMTGGRLENDNH